MGHTGMGVTESGRGGNVMEFSDDRQHWPRSARLDMTNSRWSNLAVDDFKNCRCALSPWSGRRQQPHFELVVAARCD